MKFIAHGHHNLLGMHKNTFEFTKEDHLTKEGDCIIGVNADFDPQKIKEFAKAHKFAKITMNVEGIIEVVHIQVNQEFSDDKEIVIRLGEHASPRTLGVRAEKAAKHINREMIKKLQQGSKIEVTFEAAQQSGN